MVASEQEVAVAFVVDTTITVGPLDDACVGGFVIFSQTDYPSMTLCGFLRITMAITTRG